MDDNMAKTFEQAAAFQKLWTDSFSNMAHVWSQFSPGSPPIEEARKMRSGMLKVLSESLDEFMRTPQFLEMMSKSMNGAMQFKSMARDGLHKMQDQFEIPHKEDLDGVLLALRHVERRLLERMEELDDKLAKIDQRAAAATHGIDRLEERVEDLEAAAAKAPFPEQAAPPRARTKAAAPKTKTGKRA